MMWRSGDLPPRGSRFVALFADGGGANMFYLMPGDWLPYPDGLEIWCRRGGVE